VWGGELLASGRKFDTNIKNEAVKRTSELATKENGACSDARSEGLERIFEAFNTLLVLGPCSTRNWTSFVAQKSDTDIYCFRNIPDMPPGGWHEPRVRQQRGLHNKSLSKYLLNLCVRNNYGEQGGMLRYQVCHS
jgi:hypothetical protein